MRPEAYRRLAERQLTYWWHRSRRRMARGLLEKYGLGAGARWLDLGCGPGGNFSLLDPLHPEEVTGVDLSAVALDLAAANAPKARLIEADVNERLPFGDGAFDVVTIFNVLYHDWVRDEGAVLAEAARILRSGGLLLLTEPAFDALRREMDQEVMGRRRYRATDFEPWLRAAGFETRYAGYFTSFGVPILLAAKLFGHLRPPVKNEAAIDMRPVSGPVNRLMETCADLESKMIVAGARFPIGTTLVIVARKIG